MHSVERLKKRGIAIEFDSIRIAILFIVSVIRILSGIGKAIMRRICNIVSMCNLC